MKKVIIILSVLGIIALILAIVLLNRNEYLKENKIDVLDATYGCDNNLEKFYEDEKYIYYFPCTKSKSIYLKYPNDNKILVVDALEQDKITIDKLLKLDIEVIKEKK